MDMIDRFERACKLYSARVQALYKRAVKARGYPYIAMEAAPARYRQVLARVKRSQQVRMPYPVWSGGSEYTVFDCRQTNYMFRYLHDHEHAEQELGFSRWDELVLGFLWIEKVSAGAKVGHHAYLDLRQVASLDTVGQTLYYAEHKTFPVNQREWVRAQFR